MINELEFLKNNFSKIIYFDDSAAVSHILFFIVPYVNCYWVRGLLANLGDYSKSFYGGRSYSQFYHDKYKVEDQSVYFSPSKKGTFPEKIKIAWNIGIGMYPSFENSFLRANYNKLKKISCILSCLPSIKFVSLIISEYKKEMLNSLSRPVDLSNKKALISSRFTSTNYYDSISFHRQFLLEKIKNNDLFITGRLPHKEYIKECYSIYGLLSPFGWGEICYRDFEAILSKSLLVKPDMNHLDTWPNIYHDEYYFKLDWDFKNIRNLESFLNIENKEVYYKINKSSLLYLEALEKCESRAKNMLDQILK